MVYVTDVIVGPYAHTKCRLHDALQATLNVSMHNNYAFPPYSTYGQPGAIYGPLQKMVWTVERAR